MDVDCQRSTARTGSVRSNSRVRSCSPGGEMSIRVECKKSVRASHIWRGTAGQRQPRLSCANWAFQITLRRSHGAICSSARSNCACLSLKQQARLLEAPKADKKANSKRRIIVSLHSLLDTRIDASPKLWSCMVLLPAAFSAEASRGRALP